MKRGSVWVLLLSLAGIGGVWSAQAATFNSTNFSINGNLGDSAAGGQSSSSYQLFSAGGESIAGNSASFSYKLGQGYVPQLGLGASSLQLNIQPNGLSGYWPFENTAPGATAYDESANSKNGTYSSGSGSLAGKVGNAWGDIDTTQYIAIPDVNSDFSTGNKMTISAWIYNNALSNFGPTAQGAIAVKWDYVDNAGSWAFQTAPGSTNLRMFIKDNVSDGGNHWMDSTNAGMVEDTWYFVTAVYDGSQSNANRVKLYLNGNQLSTAVTGTIPTTLTTSDPQLRVGEFVNLGRYWSGAIDELKIYSRALAPTEIAAEYAASNVGIPAGLVFANDLTPGTSQTSLFDAIVKTDSSNGYSLAINQDDDLKSGANTISPVSGSIGSPVSWAEGTTKGLGFTLYGTNATSIPGSWASGASYAAIPGTSTTFYTRTGTANPKDVLNMRLRLDINGSQAQGSYTNQAILTGTVTP